jgi:DNA-binding CsgD family transcriptional regulator
VLTRSNRDFTDADVETARQALPLVIALDAVGRHVRDVCAPVTTGSATALTIREAQILDLLASGRTAAGIARFLSISEATVRKHLEHTYAKIGCHDRLGAVMWMRGLA